MGNNTKQNTLDLIKMRSSLENYYASLFENIFHNSIVVEHLPKDLPKRYILHELYSKGNIAHDYKTKLYLPVNLTGINAYGLPTRAILIRYVGAALVRPIEDVCVLRTNDRSTPIKSYIDINIKKLVELDVAMMQNIESTKTTTIVAVDGQQQMLSLANMVNAKRLGAAVIYADSQLARQVGEIIKPVPIESPYLVDKFLQDREKILNETLSLLGVATANTEKRERVQSIEVMASQNYAIDCLNVLIDTFNYDAKMGGLDIRLKPNTNLFEMKDFEMQQINKGEVNND